MDAANIDLKGFTEDFYHTVCAGHLQPVLDTLEWVAASGCWLEVTTLLIPGYNDSDAEIHALTTWCAEHLGVDVPLHFSAFHPDWKMRDVPPTPPATLTRARSIARRNGLRYVYTGNVRDLDGGTTSCPGCGLAVVERDWYRILAYRLTGEGRCPSCGTAIAGVFGGAAGPGDGHRRPVRLSGAP
jgi:pyruvate formate lyase activating enzyme